MTFYLPNRRLLVRLLAAVSFFSCLSITVPTVHAQLVSPELMKKAESQRNIRVIVRVAISETPEVWVDSNILQSMRGASIAQGRDRVRSSLLGARHRVRRAFKDFPFMALEVGADGLRTLGSLHGLVTQVVEDELHAPTLAQSVPLVQASQAWAGGFAGLSLDGSGTVIAVLDTGVDSSHPFLGGKIVEEACFSSNDPTSTQRQVYVRAA